MPLSEHEQRLLEQIERALYDEDPKFASTVRGGKLRRPSRRRRIQGIALFVIGVVMLVLGVVFMSSTPGVGIVISVVGFLAMFSGAVLAITSFGARKKEAAAEGAAPGAPAEKERSRFTSRMEERFRRRFEQE
jgi:VIT1/CCC1 family predicted Fe2+/Mn2+ transporter